MSGHWKGFKIDEIDESFGNCELVRFSQEEDSIEIDLIFDNDRTLQFTFPNGALSYRYADEGDRLEMLAYLSKNHQNESFKKMYSIYYPTFLIEDSDYLKWFYEESENSYNDDEVTHYIFLTSNDVIDVLSTYPPKVKEVESDASFIDQNKDVNG